MYVGYLKPYRKTVSLRNEVDLLSQFPFGGLICWELFHHAVAPKAAKKFSIKEKRYLRKMKSN
jgi:hypothetical protein